MRETSPPSTSALVSERTLIAAETAFTRCDSVTKYWSVVSALPFYGLLPHMALSKIPLLATPTKSPISR